MPGTWVSFRSEKTGREPLAKHVVHREDPRRAVILRDQANSANSRLHHRRLSPIIPLRRFIERDTLPAGFLTGSQGESTLRLTVLALFAPSCRRSDR